MNNQESRIKRKFLIAVTFECEEDENPKLAIEDIESELYCCWHHLEEIEIKEITIKGENDER